MNREAELISYLKEPVHAESPQKWNRIIPFNVRWMYKPYGGRNRGRWVVFKSGELSPHKAFSDSLVATLAAKELLVKFSKDCNRGFFLKEIVEPYIEGLDYCYENFAKTLAAYKRI